MTKSKVSWSDVRPVFANANLQARFDELLRTSHQEARAALAKLQAKEDDRKTIEFFLFACSGIHAPSWGTAAYVPDSHPVTLEDVRHIRESALWLSQKMFVVNGEHEDAVNPLFYIEHAAANVLKVGSDAQRRYVHFANMFQDLPMVLFVLARFIEPWYLAIDNSKFEPPKGYSAAMREPLMAEFYAYAHTMAKLTQPEVARLLTAGRAAIGLEDQSVSGDSLKTIVNRFKGSNRQTYEDFIGAVRLYLGLPAPREPFSDLAGLTSWDTMDEIARLVRTPRRKAQRGNKTSLEDF